MQDNNGIGSLWYTILSIGAFFGVVNIWKAFKKPTMEACEEYESIIAEKDRIIKELEIVNETYRKIIDDERRKQGKQ